MKPLIRQDRKTNLFFSLLAIASDVCSKNLSLVPRKLLTAKVYIDDTVIFEVANLIEISLKLTGRGWLEAILKGDDAESIISASYLSDAPSDLIKSVILLLEGVKESKCEWQIEPGEYRWLLKKESDFVHIQIVLLNQSFSGNSKGQVVFIGTGDLLEFALSIMRGFSRIALEYPADDYMNLWGHEFPVEALGRLNKAIKKMKG